MEDTRNYTDKDDTLFRDLFAYEGRIGRLRFLLHLSIAAIPYYIFFVWVLPLLDSAPYLVTILLKMLVIGTCLLIIIPAIIRRLHDFHTSGYVVFAIAVLVIKWRSGASEGILFWLLSASVFIMLASKKGDSGKNQYGEEP